MKTENSSIYQIGAVGEDPPAPVSKGFQIIGTNRPRRNYKSASLLLVLSMLLNSTLAQEQVTLKAAQVNLESSFVSTSTEANLEIFRLNSGPSWQVNQCFELYVSSPYLDPSVYSTFWSSTQPTCTAISDGFTVDCSIRNGKADTLTIVFPTMTELTSNSQSIRFKISNFHTPFSAQPIRTINLNSFSDAECQNGRKTVSVPSPTIQQGTLPVSSVSLSSSTSILGNTVASNALIVTFTPQTTMSPSGQGTIQIGIPMWYEIGATGERMYSATASNKCSSPCMKVTKSGLVGAVITIEYEEMPQQCIKDAVITIECRQFYNPISPKKWGNFTVTTFDDQIDRRIIEHTVGQLEFDATYFSPMIMPASSFIVDPFNTMISTYSTWTLSLKVNIPLEEECYIKIYLPADFGYRTDQMQASGIFIKPDQQPTLLVDDLNIIYRTENGTIPKSSVLLAGCNHQPELGKTPFGRLDISSISTQNAIKSSQTFEVKIFKDKELTMLIAELADGVFISSGQLKPGPVTSVTIEPDDLRVQRVSPITISFTITHKLFEQASVSIRMPSGLTTPSAGSVIIVASSDGSTSATEATVLPGNIIEILNIAAIGEIIQPETKITITIEGITNQNSVRDAGDFEITTKNLIEGTYYTVDSSMIAKSYTATTGRIDAVGEMVIKNPTNYDRANIYSITFELEDVLPRAGYVQVTVPESIKLSPSTTQSSGSCKIFTCTFANSTMVRFLMQAGLPAKQQITLEIGGVTNPRSFQPTGEFLITTLDTDAESQIDSGYRNKALMTIAGQIESFSAQQSSFVNGAVNTFTFSVQANIPVIAGDYLSFTLPDDLGAPADAAAMNCTGLSNLIDLTCSVTGKNIIVTFNSFNQSSGAFTWEVSGIRNPTSTKTSPGFSNIHFSDSQGFKVSARTGQVSEVTNKYPAQLVVYNITQGSYAPNEVSKYEITFTPVNPLPVTGSIQLTYPQQITLLDGSLTVCVVTTETDSFTTDCVIDDTAKTITIKNIFSATPSYSGQITISLQKVRNAINNKPGNGFVIQTYADESQTYIVDKLNDFILTPRFDCEYPCQTCTPGNRNSCLDCWPNFDDPNFLMFYPDGTAQCRSFCDPGYTTNGNADKHCSKCDPSCGTCSENGEVGDASKCIDCSADHSFRLSMTQTCLKECSLGMYESTNTSCSQCRSTCEGCKGSESACTSCSKRGPVPFLFVDLCIEECPPGFVSVDNVCLKCKSPCATCGDHPDNCTSCDGTEGKKFTYQKVCYADCPAGSAANSETLTCFACLPGCDLCDINNQTKCLRCTAPSLAYQGECISSCPDGWHVNSDHTACRPWQLGDMGTVPFPFLIAAAISIVICLFGLMRKRAYLLHGKMHLMSPQHTLTCIVIALAPLQFLATIFQWVFSYIYGTTTFCILALLVTLASIIVNVAFQVMFTRNFDSKKIPADIDRKVRLGKMSQEEAQKYLGPRDDKFNLFKRQNRWTTYAVFTLTSAINFKFNKLFYSFFYDLKMFQSHFSRAKYYRKMQTWYQIVYLICVDLALICINVTALTQIEEGNQLFITLIEVLVLSVLSIILGSLELWLLKDTLRYTEPKKDKIKLNTGAPSSSDDEKDLDKKYDKGRMAERRRMMDGLLRQVKHNKQLFLNNKLDELIHSFGDRKCKSMMEFATGWGLEDDPQERITYPISPRMRDDYLDMGGTFKAEDAFSNQQDNVYAEGKAKFIGAEESTFVDVGYQEFQDAMQRKQAGTLSQQIEGDLEDRKQRRGNRRRGRKNKFHAQIDEEDNQDLDHVEASDHEDELQIIKEQELEEEDQMRQVVKNNSKVQQEAANTRKKQLADEQLAKQQKDLADAEARKKKAQEVEKLVLDQAAAANQKQNTMQVLQQEAAVEQAKRDADEKKRAQELARQQKKAKEERDKAEAAKQLAAKKEAAKLKTEEAKVLKKAEDEKQKLALAAAKMASSMRDPTPGRNFESRSEMNQSVYVADQVLQDFKNLEKPIDAPPRADLRTFNENDILGDLERDEKGNVVVLQHQSGVYKDRQGNLTNQRGYLVEQSSLSIVENQHMMVMFAPQDIDERGEVQAPFSLEKYNFNPHELMGDFDYTEGKPELMQTNKGLFMDKKQHRVNKHGWMTQGNHGHLIDINGHKKFDRRQLANDGDIHKLFNYAGKRFDVKDVMGIFEKDTNGRIMPQTSNKGLVDMHGRRCNERGYLTDEEGNIIDVNGRMLWSKKHLKSGEFHKIFPFTKFNISKVQGEFDLNPSGAPILQKNSQNQLIDNQKRLVNTRGYLIDREGNIIDVRGYKVFDKVFIDQDGDIPQVFMTGLLKSDTGSSLSRLMSEIEKNHPSDHEGVFDGNKDERPEGETSLDSQMEDTPANYNLANQRFDGDPYQGAIPEEDQLQSEYDSHQTGSKRKKKQSKKKLTTVMVLQPTGREKNMAGAYGGQAIGSIRRPGVKYEKERLRDGKKFRVNTSDEPQLIAHLTNLVRSGSKIDGLNPSVGSGSKRGSVAGQEPHHARLQSLMAGAESQSQGSQLRKGSKQDSRQAYEDRKKRSSKQKKPGMKDGEFEELFGKDIDQFLEDSEWDMQDIDNVSQGSAPRVKQLEKEYLQQATAGRLSKTKEQSPTAKKSPRAMGNNRSPSPEEKKKSPRAKEGPDRELLINYSDDPGVIHRGEILPFETKKRWEK